MSEELQIISEDYVSVREAARESGYVRSRIHQIARAGDIRYKDVTENFRLVSLPDVLRYATDQGHELPGDE